MTRNVTDPSTWTRLIEYGDVLCITHTHTLAMKEAQWLAKRNHQRMHVTVQYFQNSRTKVFMVIESATMAEIRGTT